MLIQMTVISDFEEALMTWGHNVNTFENVSWFDNTFNNIRGDREVSVFDKIWDAQNFQVRFKLEESRAHNIVEVEVVYILHIFFDNIQIQSSSYFVSSNK